MEERFNQRYSEDGEFVSIGRIFDFSGDDFLVGYCQGSEMRRLVDDNYRGIFLSELVSSSISPRFKFIPFSWILLVISRLFQWWYFGPMIFDYYPRQWKILKGFAQGARVSLSKAILMQSIDFLGDDVPPYDLPITPINDFNGEEFLEKYINGKKSMFFGGQCSAIGVHGSITTSGLPLIGKNWDGPEDWKKFSVFRRTSWNGDNRSLFSTMTTGMAMLTGVNNGINSAGLALVYNYAFLKKERKTEGQTGIVPYMLILREILETCSTVDEALDLLRSAQQNGLFGGACIIIMGDSITGSLVQVECTPRNVFVSMRASESNPILVATNHFLNTENSPTLVDQVPMSALLREDGLFGEEGSPLFLSSRQRSVAASRSISSKKSKISPDDIASLTLKGHDGLKKPAPGATVCCHGGFCSGYGIVLNISNRCMTLLNGQPCQAIPTTFSFSNQDVDVSIIPVNPIAHYPLVSFALYFLTVLLAEILLGGNGLWSLWSFPSYRAALIWSPSIHITGLSLMWRFHPSILSPFWTGFLFFTFGEVMNYLLLSWFQYAEILGHQFPSLLFVIGLYFLLCLIISYLMKLEVG